MPNLTSSRLARIGECRADLLDSGLDVAALTPSALRDLVRTHLDYFQLMLGDESSAAQVASLLRRGARGNPGPRQTATY